MNHRTGAWIGLVNLKVQQQFTGAQPVARQNISFEIGEADVRWLKVAFAHHRGGAKHVLRAQTNTDISAIAVDVRSLPKLPPYLNDFGAQCLCFKGVSCDRWGNLFDFGIRRASTTACTTSFTCSEIG